MFKTVVENLKEFDLSVGELKQHFEPLMKKPITEVLADATPLQKAKFNLVLLYSLNSTVWAYLRLIGKDPKDFAIKGELDRVRDYMKRAKEVEDQVTGGQPTVRVNKEAAKRTLKHALWQAAQSKGKDKDKASGSQVEEEKPSEQGKKDEEVTKLPLSQTPVSPSKKRKSNYVVDQFITVDDEPSEEVSKKDLSPGKRQKKAV